MRIFVFLVGLVISLPADADIYCSELWDDCRERVEITDDYQFIITSPYGNHVGRSVTAGTGIPYRGIVDDSGELIGRYRFFENSDVLILDMVIYHRQK